MKKTAIICDDCKKEFSCIGLGYSLTWERAKKQGWRNPNGYTENTSAKPAASRP